MTNHEIELAFLKIVNSMDDMQKAIRTNNETIVAVNKKLNLLINEVKEMTSISKEEVINISENGKSI